MTWRDHSKRKCDGEGRHRKLLSEASESEDDSISKSNLGNNLKSKNKEKNQEKSVNNRTQRKTDS